MDFFIFTYFTAAGPLSLVFFDLFRYAGKNVF